MAAAKSPAQGRSRKASLPEHFDLQAQPGIVFRRLANASHSIFHELSGQDEITGPQLTVLVTLIQNGPMIQSGMSKAVSMDKNTLAEMLRRMHERGLITRTPLPSDRRAVQISITEDGKAAASALVEPARAVGEALLAPLPPEYRPLFLKCLNILSDSIAGEGVR